MKLYIKNMVSNRCKMFVKDELLKIGCNLIKIELGVVVIEEKKIKPVSLEKFKIALANAGLKLIHDEKEMLIDRIKVIIIELSDSEDITGKIKINFSEYLSKKLNFNYTYLANIFSKPQGTTIEHFNILNKTEKVKQYILYDELSIKEISNKLGYSSTSHLSNQFKKITGLTPTQFKNQRDDSLVDIVDSLDIEDIPVVVIVESLPIKPTGPLSGVFIEIREVQVILNSQIVTMQTNLAELILKQIILEKQIIEVYKASQDIYLRSKELRNNSKNNFPRLPEI